MFAAIRLGAIVTGSSPEYGVEEMTYILKASESELVFADSDSVDAVTKAVEAASMGSNRILLLGDENQPRRQTGKTLIHELIAQAKCRGENEQVDPWVLEEGRSNAEVPCYLSFTSGTTSLPKGVSSRLGASRSVRYIPLS